MTELEDFIARLERLNVMEVAVETINETKDEFLHLNKSQLWAGKKASGSDITPSYLDDPFFKTRKQAEVYANWKQRITPSPDRNKYAPNLWINGYFYHSIQINASGDLIKFTAWPEVMNKYEDVFGLMPENQKGYNYTVFLPLFLYKIQQITGIVPN
jgi:hypothetical protein